MGHTRLPRTRAWAVRKGVRWTSIPLVQLGGLEPPTSCSTVVLPLNSSAFIERHRFRQLENL